MKIIGAKASAGTVHSGTKELSWEKKNPPCAVVIVSAAGRFVGWEGSNRLSPRGCKAPGLLKTAERPAPRDGNGDKCFWEIFPCRIEN